MLDVFRSQGGRKGISWTARAVRVAAPLLVILLAGFALAFAFADDASATASWRDVAVRSFSADYAPYNSSSNAQDLRTLSCLHRRSILELLTCAIVG